MSNCMSGGLAAASARCGTTPRGSAASSAPGATASTPACFKAARRVMSAGEPTGHLSFALAIAPGAPGIQHKGADLSEAEISGQPAAADSPYRNLMFTAAERP